MFPSPACLQICPSFMRLWAHGLRLSLQGQTLRVQCQPSLLPGCWRMSLCRTCFDQPVLIPRHVFRDGGTLSPSALCFLPFYDGSFFSGPFPFLDSPFQLLFSLFSFFFNREAGVGSCPQVLFFGSPAPSLSRGLYWLPSFDPLPSPSFLFPQDDLRTFPFHLVCAPRCPNGPVVPRCIPFFWVALAGMRCCPPGALDVP